MVVPFSWRQTQSTPSSVACMHVNITEHMLWIGLKKIRVHTIILVWRRYNDVFCSSAKLKSDAILEDSSPARFAPRNIYIHIILYIHNKHSNKHKPVIFLILIQSPFKCVCNSKSNGGKCQQPDHTLDRSHHRTHTSPTSIPIKPSVHATQSLQDAQKCTGWKCKLCTGISGIESRFVLLWGNGCNLAAWHHF